MVGIGSFYTFFPIMYAALLALWYYVLYPRQIDKATIRSMAIVVSGTAILLIGLYWLAQLFGWDTYSKLLFPAIAFNGSISWLGLLAGTAWICLFCTIVHGMVFFFTSSLGLSGLVSWVASANFVSYLIALSFALLLL